MPQHLQGQNVHLPKCPGDEISVMKCLCENVPGRNVRFQNDGKPKITFNLRLLEYKVSPYDPSKHLKARGLYGERIEKIKYL